MRILLCLVVATASVFAAEKKPIVAQSSNWSVSIQATAYVDKEDIKRIVGADLGPNIVVVEVEVSPKSGKELKVLGDDFLLRSYKDGQKSGPFSPSQIAGKGGLKLTSVRGATGGMMGDSNGPVWGGIAGMGMPRRMPGNGGGIGNASDPSTIEATEKDDKKEKDDPLLQVLKAKSLPEKDTAAPVKGLLYFPLEGKHKGKDLGLTYTGPAGKLILEFHQ
ncbi:MAG: hypothetical protein HYZ37_13540 [Candidatus Solibacter usitatus]|nr:hypothetical protein [Candidatus Solibacter usitatus]